MAKSIPSRNRIRHPKKRAFLAAYAKTGNISSAAKVAEIDRTTHHKWMANPTYAAAFEATKEEAIEVLEEEARRRAVEGVKKPVFQGGRQVGVVNEYSDTLLIFLLKGAKPDKYRDNHKHEISGPENGPIQVKQVRDQVHQMMRDPEAAQMAASLAERLSLSNAGNASTN